jgi:hypothetical protein
VINFGFKHAKGTFVKILDSDDEFVKEHFNDYLHNLQQCLKHNVDVVVNSYAFCIKNTNQIIKRKYSNNSKISFASLDKMRIFKLFTHHCITISKKLITKFKPLPIHCFYSDNDYIYQILLIGNKVALLPK